VRLVYLWAGLEPGQRFLLTIPYGQTLAGPYFQASCQSVGLVPVNGFALDSEARVGPRAATAPVTSSRQALRRGAATDSATRVHGPLGLSGCGRPPCYRAGHLVGEVHGCPISANDYTGTRNRANVARFHQRTANMALRFGLVIMNDFPPGEAPVARIGDLREQTRVAERSGIESVWVLQHYLGSMPALQPLLLLDTGDYQHLAGADEAEQQACDAYVFTDPAPRFSSSRTSRRPASPR
jgi:hypothetical protein